MEESTCGNTSFLSSSACFWRQRAGIPTRIQVWCFFFFIFLKKNVLEDVAVARAEDDFDLIPF